MPITLASPLATSISAPALSSRATPTNDQATPTSEFVTPWENDDDRLDASHVELLICYHTYDNLLGKVMPMPGLAAWNLEGELHLMSTGEPSSFTEAEQDETWQVAMQEEIDFIERNHTWELVELPYDHRTITLKWVYKLK
jgi:hypothetical protein